ncbi:hypothetical protein [Alkalihalobacillus sp. 1P02AB]|uniref:hypothetical protein n=1 Tax=Alkalihalobacillus sp. 1P02AB TaxID=3132260 RepID=UPI0039A4D5B3
MNNESMKLVNTLLLLSCFLLVYPFILTPISVQAQLNEEEKLVEELADALEFMFEEAIIFDANGNPIGMNFDKLEEKFGDSSELRELKYELEVTNEVLIDQPLINKQKFSIQSRNCKPNDVRCITNTPRSAAVDRCIGKGLSDFFGLGIAAGIGAAIDLLWEDKWGMAARELIKIGVKGSVLGIAAQVSWITVTCIGDPKKYS